MAEAVPGGEWGGIDGFRMGNDTEPVPGRRLRNCIVLCCTFKSDPHLQIAWRLLSTYEHKSASVSFSSCCVGAFNLAQ